MYTRGLTSIHGITASQAEKLLEMALSEGKFRAYARKHIPAVTFSKISADYSPQPRGGHAMCLHSGWNKLYLFGGSLSLSMHTYTKYLCNLSKPQAGPAHQSSATCGRMTSRSASGASYLPTPLLRSHFLFLLS